MSVSSHSSAFQRSPPSRDRERIVPVAAVSSDASPTPVSIARASLPFQSSEPLRLASLRSAAAALSQGDNRPLLHEALTQATDTNARDLNSQSYGYSGAEILSKTNASFVVDPSGGSSPFPGDGASATGSSLKTILPTKEFTPRVAIFVSSSSSSGSEQQNGSSMPIGSTIPSNSSVAMTPLAPKSAALIRAASFEGSNSLRRSASSQQRADLQVLRGILAGHASGSQFMSGSQHGMETFEVNEKIFQDTKTSMSCDSIELCRIPSFTSQMCTSASALDEYASLRLADPVVEAFLRIGASDEMGSNAGGTTGSSAPCGVGNDDDDDIGEDAEVCTTLSLSCLDGFGDDGPMDCGDDDALTMLEHHHHGRHDMDVHPHSSRSAGVAQRTNVSVSPVVTPAERKRRRSLPAGTTATALVSMAAQAAAGGANSSFTMGSRGGALGGSESARGNRSHSTAVGPSSPRTARRTTAKANYGNTSDSARGTSSKAATRAKSSASPHGYLSSSACASPYSEMDGSVVSASSGGDTDAEIYRVFRTSPRLVEYVCSSCKSVYHDLSASNIFSSCRLAYCPHCGQSQYPTVELHSPINAFELDPSVAVLFEETNMGYCSDEDTDAAAVLHDSKGYYQGSGNSTSQSCQSNATNIGGKHHALSSMLSPSSEDTSAPNVSVLTWGNEEVPLCLAKDAAAELLVLMTHARFCSEAHDDKQGSDTCQNVKLMMLHARDCPCPIGPMRKSCDCSNGCSSISSSSSNLMRCSVCSYYACPAIDESTSVPECGFVWCRDVKSVSLHLLHCKDGQNCEVCFPQALPPVYAQLALDNQKRIQQVHSQQRQHIRRDEVFGEVVHTEEEEAENLRVFLDLSDEPMETVRV